jgi:hypothetical protein
MDDEEKRGRKKNEAEGKRIDCHFNLWRNKWPAAQQGLIPLIIVAVAQIGFPCENRLHHHISRYQPFPLHSTYNAGVKRRR